MSQNLLKKLDESDPIYQAMGPDIQRFRAGHTYTLLSAVSVLGYVPRDTLTGKVLDFGCDTGGCTYVLVSNGADITAVDLNGKSIDQLVATGILPQEKALAVDGIEYMSKQPDESYDLVTAFMLDPSFGKNRSLFYAFWNEAKRIIKPNGRIIIQSDAGTISEVSDILGSEVDRVLPSTEYFCLVGYKGNPPTERQTTRSFEEGILTFSEEETLTPAFITPKKSVAPYGIFMEFGTHFDLSKIPKEYILNMCLALGNSK